ncbi:hypothetical protein C8R46DRAFT_1224679 [Mycena filopes]|nr:hypothetical protein C8R46DRAFT_1224679 [Mycena filopes]
MLRLSTRKILCPQFPARPLSTLVRSQQSLRSLRNPQYYIGGSRILPTSPHGSVLSPMGSHPFHSTPSRKGAPLIPLLAVLKASAAMELVRTAARVVLTVIPVLLFKNHKTRRHLKYAALHGIYQPEFLPAHLSIKMALNYSSHQKRRTEIAAQLAGPGWYQAVGEILSEGGPPQFIPPTDWRYGWVRDTLRELERTIPVLINEEETCQNWSSGGDDDIPLPPPAEYPLRPRPRASEYLRMWCDHMCKQPVVPLWLWALKGGGGIVVYSGFLDEILARAPPENDIVAPPAPSSWWSSLVGGIFTSSTSPPTHPVPTPSQTAELAVLLSHELAHLVLSHHLETLSRTVVRVVIFPITMMFGPFVNDAVAQLGKIGSGELEKVGEYCTSVKQEIEADVVSARLLAHAGYDARKAITFWETRSNNATVRVLLRLQIQLVHPVHDVRVHSLKEELLRWETERRADLRKRVVPREESSVVLSMA